MRRDKWCVVIGCVVLLAAVGGLVIAGEESEARRDEIYTCGCGKECDCDTVSLEPGKCSCGKELVWGHVVEVVGSTAMVCQCEKGCTCTKDEDAPGKCACGKELKKVSLKGTGIYFCNCGGSCTCNTLSAEPGECGCGMALKKADD